MRLREELQSTQLRLEQVGQALSLRCPFLSTCPSPLRLEQVVSSHGELQVGMRARGDEAARLSAQLREEREERLVGGEK